MTILQKRQLNGRPVLLNFGSTNTGGSFPPSQTFSVQNWAASASTGFHKRGLWWKRGDIPAGSVPALSSGAAQFYGLRFWSDGSLKTAKLLLRDAAFAQGESRSYALTGAAGALPSGSVALAGNGGLANAIAGRDVKVTFANVVQSDGAITALNASGAFTASLAGHAATGTPVDRAHQRPRRRRLAGLGHGHRRRERRSRRAPQGQLVRHALEKPPMARRQGFRSAPSSRSIGGASPASASSTTTLR